MTARLLFGALAAWLRGQLWPPRPQPGEDERAFAAQRTLVLLTCRDCHQFVPLEDAWFGAYGKPYCPACTAWLAQDGPAKAALMESWEQQMADAAGGRP